MLGGDWEETAARYPDLEKIKEQEKEIQSLRSQVTQLQAEAVENAALVERLRKTCKDVLSSIPKDIFHMPQHETNHLVAVEIPDLLERAISEPPPQCFGKAVLELGQDAVQAVIQNAWSLDQPNYPLQEKVENKVQALTPEYKTWLGVE